MNEKDDMYILPAIQRARRFFHSYPSETKKAHHTKMCTSVFSFIPQ